MADDYGDDDFANDDYQNAYESTTMPPAPADGVAASRAAARAAAYAPTPAPAIAAKKLPPGFVANRETVTATNTSMSSYSAVAPARQRSRPRLSQKGATPSLPSLNIATRSDLGGGGLDQQLKRELSLPVLGAGGSSSGVVQLDDSELLASEQLSVAVSAEMQAAEHLKRVRARVQRELRKVSSSSAVETVRKKKLQIANAMRADMDKAVGRDMTAAIAHAEPASDEEVRKLSELLNQQLMNFHPDARNFFVLFKHIDIDGSRRISFRELARLIREELRVSKSELPEPRLHALWKVLDENASGFVDAGELSRFMRIGRPAGGLGNRERLILEKKHEHKQQLLDAQKRSGKHLVQQLVSKDVPRASEEEVRELSQRFNGQLSALRPRDATNGNNFYRLFKHMDVDGSGRISFKEFSQMVRHELGIAKAELPLPRLQGLWRALDDNESGYICAGEFGRFMKIAAGHAPLDPVTEAKERQRLEDVAERDRNAALWKARAARRSHNTAKRLAREAAELEAALAAATGGGASTLPPINGGAGAASLAKLLEKPLR